MSGERISRALGDISDELLSGAMKNRWKKRRRNSAIAAVAAAAVLLAVLGLATISSPTPTLQTAPGVITVLAHGLDEGGNPTETGEALEEGERYYPQIRQDADSCQTFPFSFLVDEGLYPGMELTLQLSTARGIFYKYEHAGQEPEDIPEVMRLLLRYHGQEYETEVDRNVYWQTDGFDYLYMEERVKAGNYDYGSVYLNRDFEQGTNDIHVILRADGHIVAFCVLEIVRVEESAANPQGQFRFEIIASYSYPQVDGAWQNVTEEDVQTRIRELKLERLRESEPVWTQD